MSSLAHESNLLALPLEKIVSQFLLTDHRALSFCNEIILNISEVNTKALIKFNLQEIIPQVLLALLTSDENSYICVYIDIVSNLLLIENSPYLSLLKSNTLIEKLCIELLRK